MKIRGYGDLKWIGHRAIFNAMRCAGESVNPDEANREMEILIRHAKKNSGDYRDARAHYRHHRNMANRKDHYKELIKYMDKLESKYGYRSMTFQYMLEAVSCVTKTFDQVNRDYMKNPNPPAFDSSRRSPYSVEPENANKEDLDYALEGQEMRDLFFKWIENTEDIVITKIRRTLREPRSTDLYGNSKKMAPKKYYTTNNGSASGIVFKGYKLMDIEGQCFVTKAALEHVYPAISEYFGIKNMSPEDDRVYIEIPDSWQESLVLHMMVPDKDGKSREVYYLLPVISAVGKGIAEILDPKMRILPGIYTYDQKLWIEEALIRGWNIEGMIITVDMEKFSDTIVRKFLLKLLVKLGIPRNVAREMDDLFSLLVWDKILEKPLGRHEVVLQGQYSIFMLMSIMNLCLQRYIIWLIDQNQIDNLPLSLNQVLSAVLGDDTAIRFQSKDYDKAWSIINKQYGSMGMTINQLKSDVIIDGNGQGDFAKTNFDRYGIIDHLNPKNVQNRNIDGIINDILWLSKDCEYKQKMLESLFDAEIAGNILNMSIINGGCSDHPITKGDISYLINNMQKFNLQYRELDILEEERVLREIGLEYRNMGYSLKNSPLYYYLPKDVISTFNKLNVDQQDEMIITFVLNANTIGMTIDYARLSELEGRVPSELHMSYLNAKIYDIESEDAYLWMAIRQYDQFVAKRKTEKTGSYSTIYLPCMDGTLSDLMSNYIAIPFSEVTSITNMDDYRKEELLYKKGLSTRIMQAEQIWIFMEWHWGVRHYYISYKNINDPNFSRRDYRRLYAAFDSKYPVFTEEDYDTHIKPIFRKHNIRLSYSDFVNLYRH